MRRECPVFVRAKRSVVPYLTAGRPGFNAAVATETAGKASSLYGGSQNLARFCGVRTGWFYGSDGFAGGRQNGRESCDRLFVMRTDNLRAAVAVILLDFQSLKNVAPRHNPNEFGSAFGLRFVFKSRPAMKKILLMVALASLCASVSAQKSADRKAARAAQKEYYRALDARMHDSAMKALQDSAFILKADKVTFRRGRIAYVSSTTNFVSMEGERAVIQLAFPNLPWPGANGLGGITVDGIVTNVSVKTDKKGFVRYQMSVVGSGTSSWMAEIVLNPLDNKASVTVYPTYSSNRVTLSGELVPYDRRSVYKGRSLF